MAGIAALIRDLLPSTGSAAADPGGHAGHRCRGVVGMVDAVIGRWLDDPAGVGRDELLRRLVVIERGAVAAVLEGGAKPPLTNRARQPGGSDASQTVPSGGRRSSALAGWPCQLSVVAVTPPRLPTPLPE